MNEWTWRLAQPSDAEAFSNWSAKNQQIDPQDLQAGMGKNNPTVLFLVAEKDGVAIAFAPIYLSAVLAHLGFNPESSASEKLRAMEVLTEGAMGLIPQLGIREITTLSKEGYGVAKWAVKHGFKPDTRTLFRLNLNKETIEEHVNVQ